MPHGSGSSGDPRSRGTIVEPVGADRNQILPILRESFTGYYRWHAKRELRIVPTVRALRVGVEWWGAVELDRLAPQVGYVYYVFTGAAHRRQGVAATLLDDALAWFRQEGVSLVYAVVGGDQPRVVAVVPFAKVPPGPGGRKELARLRARGVGAALPDADRRRRAVAGAADRQRPPADHRPPPRLAAPLLQ